MTRRFRWTLALALFVSSHNAFAHGGMAYGFYRLLPFVALALSVVIGFVQRSILVALGHAALVVVLWLTLWNARLFNIAAAAFFLLLLHMVVILALIVRHAVRKTPKNGAA